MLRVLIVVEDVAQQELVARILGFSGFERVLGKDQREWKGGWAERLVPVAFPVAGRGLNAPHPAPVLLRKDGQIVAAILCAEGDSKLVDRLEVCFQVLDQPVTACAFVMDADFREAAPKRHEEVLSQLSKRPAFSNAFSAPPGVVTDGSPRSGIFILPDNSSPGTLETLLLESAGQRFRKLVGLAASYVNVVADGKGLAGDDLEQCVSDLKRPGNAIKATTDAIAAVLTPGKEVQFAMKRQDWLNSKALELPRFQRLQNFLLELFKSV